jgi:hypothetical protein
MRTNAFFQKKKVWLFAAFSFLLSNTSIGSSCYSENEEEDEVLLQQALLQQIHNAPRPKKKKKMWNKEENEKLLEQMSNKYPLTKKGKPDWQKISESFPDRDWRQCRSHWTYVLNPGINKGPWNEEEDQKLNDAVERYLDPDHPNKFPWAEIAKEIPGRTSKQCQTHWRCTLNPNIRKGPWNKKEDATLTRLVRSAIKNNNNDNNLEIPWTNVAALLSGRTAAQCYERWVYTLDSNIKRVPWTETETQKLMEIVGNYIKNYSNSKINWQVIAQSLAKKTDEVDETNSTSHRTDSQCCSHWKYIKTLGQKLWTPNENEALKKRLQNPPCDNQNRIQWTKIADESIPGKTADQCRSHARGYKLNIKRQTNNNNGRGRGYKFNIKRQTNNNNDRGKGYKNCRNRDKKNKHQLAL